MTFASLPTPSRCTLLMWAAAICAAIAMALAIVTHRPADRGDEQAPQQNHGWVRGLFANDDLHDVPQGGR